MREVETPEGSRVPANDLQKSEGRNIRRPGEPREFALDVLVDGQPVRRDARVVCTATDLQVDADRLALDSVFWVSRRAGLVLLFSRDRTLALLGKSGDLEEIARAIERGSDRAAQRLLLQPLTREVVVCTAGTAVSGRIGEARVSGLHLAVFTQRGLHLFARDRQHSVEWPVDRVGEISPAPREHGRGALKLDGDRVSLTLRYLFPEEIHAIARVARRRPRPVARQDGAIEMFARGEVAPPPPAELPEFALSAEALDEACRRAAGGVIVPAPLGARFDESFFQRHFLDLGEIALGPLMLRKSAAAGAGTLQRAVEALGAEELRQDAAAAFHGAADHLFEVFRGAVERILAEKRLGREEGREALATPEDRARVDAAMDDHMADLDPLFARVLARQHLLHQRLQALEHAVPEAEDTGVEEAAAEWRAELVRLDRAYGRAWSELLEEIASLWTERLLPRLERLAVARRRLSEGARLAILATATFVVLAGLAIWLL